MKLSTLTTHTPILEPCKQPSASCQGGSPTREHASLTSTSGLHTETETAVFRVLKQALMQHDQIAYPNSQILLVTSSTAKDYMTRAETIEQLSSSEANVCYSITTTSFLSSSIGSTWARIHVEACPPMPLSHTSSSWPTRPMETSPSSNRTAPFL